MCFLFAEYLQPHLNYPIGLVGSYWGGTTIEAWSPPEAIQACPVVDHGPEKSVDVDGYLIVVSTSFPLVHLATNT